MMLHCPRCGHDYDESSNWTICPHALRPKRAIPLFRPAAAHASRPVQVADTFYRPATQEQMK